MVGSTGPKKWSIRSISDIDLRYFIRFGIRGKGLFGALNYSPYIKQIPFWKPPPNVGISL